MEKTNNTPWWVYLALSSIETKKGALRLIWSCMAFAVYCVPWSELFPSDEWLKTAFLLDDWSWFAMMVPITAWYWLSMRWADNNSAWQGNT